MDTSRIAAFVRSALPDGSLLPEEAWQRRHRAILVVLWLHVPLLLIVGLVLDLGVVHPLLEASIIALFATAATFGSFGPTVKASIATVGLVASSAILVHFSEGLIEMHFHFFVMVAIVTLYQAWAPFLVAIAFVVLHHGTVGILDPSAVYNHPSAVNSPWRWAAIHGLFIAAESAAGLTAWKMNELALNRERTARDDLELANVDLAEAQSMARIGSWDWHIPTDRVWWSEELYRIFGVTPKDYTPSYEGFMGSIHPDDITRVRATVEDAFQKGVDFDYQAKIIRADGETRVIHAIGKSTIGPDGVARKMAGTVQDITERRVLEEQIEYQAFHDSLTNLANRSLFFDRVSHALARQQRGAASLAVLFVDLDDFKTVNDSMGHSFGDKFLIEAVKKIGHILRPSDTFARLGGDEFGILLEDLVLEQDAIVVARRLLDLLAQPISIEDTSVAVQASLGIAFANRTEEVETEELLRRADTAMYVAKRHGKGTFEVFQEGMAEDAIERLRLRADLQRALHNQEFVLRYQPIVRLDTGEITGVEALVRWLHPERGLVPPLNFIPLAEETGLIVPLTAWVLQEACHKASGWKNRQGQPLTVAVNISAVCFKGDELERQLAATLRSSGLEPSRLILEITESVLMHDAETINQRLLALKKLGTQVAIDDFGTGYSSLSYLQDLPIDLLKVDKSFIDSVDLGLERSALARAVIKLGRTLDLKVVAEGVERTEQAEALAELACQYAQGYLFAQPLDEDALTLLLKAGNAVPSPDRTPATPS